MITLFSQPWLITDESFAAMCKVAEQFDLEKLERSLTRRGPQFPFSKTNPTTIKGI